MVLLQVALMVIIWFVRTSVQDVQRRLLEAEAMRERVHERLATLVEAQRHNDLCLDRLHDRVEKMADLYLARK
jgi:hypothetical protein